MERLGQILLEGILNHLNNSHKYPWVGLDEKQHLVIVFNNADPHIKDFEQALSNLSSKNPDEIPKINISPDQEFTQFKIPLHAERLHNLLIKENAYYAQQHYQGSILSILYPNRPSMKLDAICISPIHPDMLRLHNAGQRVSETIAVQLGQHLETTKQSNTGSYRSACIQDIMHHHQGAQLINSIIQELIGLPSLDTEIQHYGMHPNCLIVPMSEEARFIYANHTTLAHDELEDFQSLEISYEHFISHLVEKLKLRLQELESTYQSLIQKNNPEHILDQLQNEKDIYLKYYHIYLNHPELKTVKQQLETLTPILSHVEVFLRFENDPMKLSSLVAELPDNISISPIWQDKLRDLYQKILDKQPLAIDELKTLHHTLKTEVHQLKDDMEGLEKKLMQPLVALAAANHSSSNFFEPNKKNTLNQHRLKRAIESPYDIPLIVEELDKLLDKHLSKFNAHRENQATLIENLKSHIERLNEIFKTPALSFRHQS